ncbi:hypothetical protein [Streptomyces sp. NPDC058424]|uniref:hypothetical protein n=1 Tax=Streptomyces sp. NPDC058424 TaxID=3346491 RepID=UPI00365ABB38
MDIIVEIHVPLREAPGAPEGSYAFPWIDQVEDFLAEQEVAEVHDEGEEYGEAYVFFISGAAEADLLAVASRVTGVPGTPSPPFSRPRPARAAPAARSGRRPAVPGR